MMKGERIAKIVLLSNEKQISELFTLGSDLKNAEIITFNEDLNAIVKSYQKDSNPKFYEDLISNIKSWEDCLKEAKEFFDGWKKVKIGEKEIFGEMLAYNKFSLLDIDTDRYLSAHTEIITNVLFKISVIKSIIRALKPEIVIILYPQTDWERLTRIVCDNENVTVIYHNKVLDNIKLKFEQRFLKSEIKLFGREFKMKIPLCIVPFILMLRCRWELLRVQTRRKICLNPYDKREILFFLINKKYSDVVIQVVKSIQEDSLFKPLVLVPINFDGSKILKENKIPFEYINSYLRGDISKETHRIYSEILKNWRKIKHQKEFREKMYRYQDLDLEDFLSKEVEKTMMLSASSIENISLMMRIIELYGAKVLCTPHNTENIVKSLTAGCKQVGIPVIGVTRSTAIRTPVYGTFICDRVLVSGDYAKDVISSWGFEEDKIAVVGSPVFDELLSKLKDKDIIERKTRNTLGINPKFHIVIYLTQSRSGRFGHQERLNEIRTIYNVVKEIDDVFLIVKIHPTESDIEVYTKVAKEIGLNKYTIVKNELSLDDLVLTSTVAITKDSTTGFNALIGGCKLIVVGFHDKTFSNNFFVEAGVALTAASSEELYNNIIKALTKNEEERNQNSKITNFLEDHFYKLDCKSAERIKQNIYVMIRS